MATHDETHLHFAGHALDLRAQRLWRHGVPVELRPAAWSLLLELLRHPGALCSVQALSDALWPGQAVTPKALTNRIAELREALGDDSVRQELIQTVPRRGYRFVAEVTRRPPSVRRRTEHIDRPDHGNGSAAALPVSSRMVQDHELRGAALQRLWQAFDAAADARRQVVLVDGEPGLGKTWLVDRFSQSLAVPPVWLCRGQCVGQASERESFGPWLALLADLCAGPAGPAIVPLLRRRAPSWLLQLPWLQDGGEPAALRADLAGAATGRMLREGCALFETLAQQHTVVVVLEDLHWADAASIDLLHYLLQGRAPARLLVVGTWRPVDAALNGHPLAALAPLSCQGSLPLHLLPLQPLDDADTARLVHAQVGDVRLAERLLPTVQRAAQGNPLVILAALQHLQRQDGAPWDAMPWMLPVTRAAAALPGPLRHVVEARLGLLPDDERRLVQAASVVGLSFTPQLLAAALQTDAAPLALACRGLAARQLFIRAQPDAASPDRHGFLHDAYRQALYDSVPLADRQRMHGHVARCIAQQVGDDLTGVAPTLAATYMQAAMPAEAARWLEQTALASLRRFDHRAAAQPLQVALQQLSLLPTADDEVRRERLRLHLDRGNLLNALRIGHPEAPADYTAAEALASAVGDSRSRVRALLGLTFTLVLQGRLQQAVAAAADMVRLAEAEQPGLAAAAHTYAGIAALAHGQFDAARRHCEHALSLPFEPGVPVYVDLPSLSRLNLGMTLVEMGDIDAGLRQMVAAVERSRARGLPHDLMQALYWMADASRIAGDTDRAGLAYQEALAHAERLGVEGFELAARFGLLACAAPAPGRCAAMAELLERRAALGECWNGSGFALALAQACLADGDLPGCRRAVAAGMSLQGGERGGRHQAALARLAAQAGVADTTPA